MKKLWK